MDFLNSFQSRQEYPEYLGTPPETEAELEETEEEEETEAEEEAKQGRLEAAVAVASEAEEGRRNGSIGKGDKSYGNTP
jgi:predicted Zn-dependent protease